MTDGLPTEDPQLKAATNSTSQYSHQGMSPLTPCDSVEIVKSPDAGIAKLTHRMVPAFRELDRQKDDW